MTERHSPTPAGPLLRQDDTPPPAGRRRRRAAASAPRRTWLAVTGYTLLGIACAVVTAVTFLLIATPVELIRDQLAQSVKARTGRDLVIAGPTSISLFPRLAISVADVSLSPPQDMGGPPTLAIPTLSVELGISSLLSRQLTVRRIVLNRPVIALTIDAQGRRSWEVTTLAQPTRYAQAAGPTASDAPAPAQAAGETGMAADLQDLAPASVRIVEGTVRYADERTGVRHELSALDTELAVKDIAAPVEGSGSFHWRGERVTFQGALGPARAVLEGRPARLSLRLGGRPFDAKYEGRIALLPGVALDGSAAFNAPSTAVLTGWLSGSGARRELGAVALTTHVAASGGEVGLSELEAKIGDSTLDGALSVESKGVRPYVRGRLKLSELDFGRLLVRSSAEEAERPSGPAPPAGNAAPDAIPRDTGGSDRTRVRGFTKRSGWSDNIIDLAPLGLVDADLSLLVDRMVYRDVRTGQSRLTLALKDGAASIKLEDMLLYNGRGRGVLTLDGKGQTPVAGANLTLDGVAMAGLLKDALGFQWIDGRGSIALALAGQGASERQIIETLNGKVEAVTSDGVITGIDVGKILQGLERGRLSVLKIAPGDSTPFSELAATFSIANGIAHNTDLRLVNPHVRVTGSGTADLPARQLDYTVRPKIIAAPPSDQGAIVNLSGLEIPVRVSGPWEKPTFTPELKGILKDSEQVSETIKQIGKNLKSQEVQDAVRGLLGGGDGEKRVKPRELLDKLLKKDP